MINFRRIYMLIADFTTSARKPDFYKLLLGSLKSQLTVSANPLGVVGWRCKPESL